MARFFCGVETNDVVQQVQLHAYLGGDSSDSRKRPLDLLGERSLSASCSVSFKFACPPAPVVVSNKKKKKKKRGEKPLIDCDGRREELRAKVRYACTQLKVFTAKKSTDFQCRCCYKKYPNKEMEGKVITDSSSLPACKDCSDFVYNMADVLRHAVEAGFGDPTTCHPVATAMRNVKKAHNGQHGPSCAACLFLISCRRAHQWRKLDGMRSALRCLQGCPEKEALTLIDLADRQARHRVRGSNHAPVDKTKLATAADVNAVRDANIRDQIRRVERCAGVMLVETPLSLDESTAEALADEKVKEWVTKHPDDDVPMFVRVRVKGGSHVGVFTNKMTKVDKDEKVRDCLDTWYRLAQAYKIEL